MIICRRSQHRVHVRAYKLSWRIPGNIKNIKTTQKNSITMLVPPGGSSSTTRQFMLKPPELVLSLCVA